MTGWTADFATAALHRLDPERAHALAVATMRLLPLPAGKADDPRLAVQAFGLRFGNPLGIAAGFDKNAAVSGKAAVFGFGHIEVGTLTPKPQPGNPRPRVFRLSADRAVINRYGFNNDGHAAAHARLARQRDGNALVGINIGANKEAVDRVADYTAGIERFADVADYFTLNVSSPNTPGLRDLQASAALDELLARTVAARDAQIAQAGRRPLLLKIAPDLGLAALDDIVAVARRRAIDGLIVSNTTVARPDGLRSSAAHESGGLSGRPLFAPSTRMLAHAFLRVNGAFPLIGVGGIDSGEAAWAKIEAGASLIQLYSGLVYEGPRLVSSIKRHLLVRLGEHGCSLADVVGRRAAAWAEQYPT